MVLLIVAVGGFGSPTEEVSEGDIFNTISVMGAERLNEAHELRLHTGYISENAMVIADLTCVLATDFVYHISRAFEENGIYEGVQLPVTLSQRKFDEFVENEIAYLKGVFELSEPSACWVREHLWSLFRSGDGGFTVDRLTEEQVRYGLESLKDISCGPNLRINIQNGVRIPETMDGLMNAIGGMFLSAGNLSYAAIPYLGKIAIVVSTAAGAWTVFRSIDELSS